MTSLQSSLRKLGAALFDLFLAPCCAGCGADLAGGVLCEVCATQIERIQSPRCPRCGISYDGAGDDHLCSGCILAPPPFESTVAAFAYAGPIADGLRALKYGPRPERAGPLSRLWREVTPAFPEVEVAVPVPLDADKLRRRGFNQTVLLSRRLLRAHGVPLECSVLFRAEGGPTQASLSIAERLEAPRGAFRPLSARARARLRDRRVLLVDDVMTTGATARECARVLLEGGAAEVHVAVLARTIREVARV